MSYHPRAVSCGVIAGLIGAAVGAGSVLSLGSHLGWVAGLSAGAVVGGLGIGLASSRLLRDATGCLAALGDEEPGHNRGAGGPDGERPIPLLGWPAFDAWVAHLDEVLTNSRHVQVEYAAAERLVRQLGQAMNGSEGTGVPSGRSEPDEGSSAHSVFAFLDQFRRTAAQINQDLAALEEANERVASGAHDQSEAVSRTATSVEALSDRIDRISRHAREASSACERVRQEASQGLEQVHSVIEGMDRLLARIEANGRKVRHLEDRSTEIGVIVELIRGISGRTDMLALNATIESIRAGEHGRGFAIVAEEIRKLAERAAAATREIGTLVEAIQADAQESIRALNEEQAETQRESQRIRETGSSLERISQVAEKSAQLVDGISRSSNDQVVTTQELVRAVQRISDVTQQTQERTTQARTFISALSHSWKPWQRLTASDPVPSVPSGQGRQAPDGSPSSGAGLAVSSTWSPHGPSRVRRDPAREDVQSERFR